MKFIGSRENITVISYVLCFIIIVMFLNDMLKRRIYFKD